jgi:uncharacterized protein (DUF2252 family)
MMTRSTLDAQRAPRTTLGDVPSGRAERAAAGKAARASAPLDSHAGLDLAPDRDPVGLLLGQAESRVSELVPMRHARMLASPFTFFRGAALPMAADLAGTPSSGLRVQLCGDAHLANFGAFASPERRLVFDLNDFDETLPGPFEWDVKRLAASFAVAARDDGFSRRERRRIVVSAVAGYRKSMREFAGMPMLAVWYSGIDVEAALRGYRDRMDGRRYERTEALLTKARKRDSTQALGKLTGVVDGRRRIVSDPPLVVPVEDLFPDVKAEALYQEVRWLVSSYTRTLQPDRRHLLRQFQVVQLARKVVGVGSVGTRAWIILLEADGGEEHLFLQAKEAQRSVLAEYAGRSKHSNQGQRVVVGQHLMQAASDIFLGWQRTTGLDGVDRDYYVRQLRDWKLSAPIEQMIPSGMRLYANLCAWTLARAHARTGDRIAIAAYLGKSDRFDNAVADFAESYADLTESDHRALKEAVAEGRVEAPDGV